MELLTLAIGVLVITIVFIIGTYNRMVTAKQKVTEAWSDVDVQLKRRHDLIPNIVNTVKGYAKHEKDLIEKVTNERTQALAVNKDNLQQLGLIEGAIEADLGALLMVAEAYPDLKANQNFLKLQSELSETEDQIASSRRIYNANVNYYNTLLQIFPLNFVAKLSDFKESSFFEFKEARAVPSVKMD